MRLQEVFEQLVDGELSQLSIAGAPQGQITEAMYPKLLGHINLGLTALYKRFNLKEGLVTVGLVPGHYTYELHSRFAVSNAKSREAVKYLLDTDAPFKDNVLKVEYVGTAASELLPLNVAYEPLSVVTPSLTTLRVPEAIVDGLLTVPELYRTTTLDVRYRANHNKLTIPLGFYDPARVELELPYSHLEPLLFFVASRVHSPRERTPEDKQTNDWYMKYENACQRLEMENYQVDRWADNSRLQRNGWV